MPDKPSLEAKGWIQHLLMFLRTFEGVPACDALAKQHEKLLKKQRDKGVKHWGAYWRSLKGDDPKGGLAAGARALREGFLYHRTADHEFLKTLEDWSKDAKKHKIPKKLKATFDTLIADFRSARKAGQRAFDDLNQAHGKLP